MYIFAISLTFCLTPFFAVLSRVNTGFLDDIILPSSVLAAFIVINIVVLDVDLVHSRLPSVGLVKRASVHPQRLMKLFTLVLPLATRLRLMATSALMALFPAVDDSDKPASSNAHVQIVPGDFVLGESSAASVGWIFLAALACRVIVGFDAVASALLLSSMRTILADSKDIPKSSSSVDEDNEAHDDLSSLAEDYETADETADDNDDWSSEDDDDNLTVVNDEDEMFDDDDVTVVDDTDTTVDHDSAFRHSLRRQLLRLQLAHVLRDSRQRCPHTLASRCVMGEFSPPRDVGDLEAFLAHSRETYHSLSSVAPVPPASVSVPPAAVSVPPAAVSVPPAAVSIPPAAVFVPPAAAQLALASAQSIPPVMLPHRPPQPIAVHILPAPGHSVRFSNQPPAGTMAVARTHPVPHPGHSLIPGLNGLVPSSMLAQSTKPASSSIDLPAPEVLSIATLTAGDDESADEDESGPSTSMASSKHLATTPSSHISHPSPP
ncbi:hypothetical protein B0H14DRAFT_2918217 [Mycena olivaceomarginata]|nr:hypothetical protein B0H14DRAFT_2918217 [Mycena olivaceomarginata]